jgi:uncharacterized protein YjbJ (UPF0337 family)
MEAKMNEAKTSGVKEQLKGVVDFAAGKLTGNKDRELKGQVEITNGSRRIAPIGRTTCRKARTTRTTRRMSKAA